METLTAPPPTQEQVNTGQLDLTTEAGWDNPDQIVLPTQTTQEKKEDKDYKYRGQEVAIDMDGIETGWEFFNRDVASGKRPAGSRVENGTEMVTVRSPAGEGAWLVKEIPATEFEEFQVLKAQRETAKGTSSTPDTLSPPVPESQDSQAYRDLEFDVKPTEPEVTEKPWLKDEVPSEQDWRRIDREAKAYFDNFEDPQDVVGLRQDLANYLKEVSDATRKQLSELGLETDSKIADQAVQQTVEAAKPKKITELVEQALPYEEDSRKERKDVNNSRESLTKLLNMGQEQFDQLTNDWRQHEMRELHTEALEDDKKFKVGKERKAARSEVEALDEKYGSALAEISALPLDKEAGGLTHNTLDAYLGRQRKIESTNNELVDPVMLIEASQAQAVLDLQGQLRQKYQAEGLNEEQIQAKLGESAAALQTWVEHVDGNGIALADLRRYENQGNKEQMLSGRRQKASEYIGSMLLPRFFRKVLGREKSSESSAPIDVAEVLERSVDHNDSRGKAGGEVLTDAEKARGFLGRVMTQLETARTLSRNESTLRKGFIYLTALEKSLGAARVAAWEAIPEEKKRAARKKIMLGMAATSAALVRLSAKAAAKAQKAGATGAAAGTIWAGNKLRR